MPRGKRSQAFQISKEPAVTFVAFVVKVLRPMKWPKVIEASPEVNLIKAKLLYDIGGSVSFAFRSELQFYRQMVAKSEKGTALAKSLKDLGFLRMVDADRILAEAESLKAIMAIDEAWVARVTAALEKSIKNTKNPRFSPEGYAFRLFSERILEREQESHSKNYNSAFLEWCDKEGFKFGVLSVERDEIHTRDRVFDYDTLRSRCEEEDRSVDSAYQKLGFEDFGHFLSSKYGLYFDGAYEKAVEDCFEKKFSGI